MEGRAIKRFYIFIIALTFFISFIVLTFALSGNLEEDLSSKNSGSQISNGKKYLSQFDFKTVKLDEAHEFSSLEMKYLLSIPSNAILLGLEQDDPAFYTEKKIWIERYEAFNHPLENVYRTIMGEINENVHVYVHLLIVDQNVIGSYSYFDEEGQPQRFGGIYNIEGKTIEEITGMSYIEWIEEYRKND